MANLDTSSITRLFPTILKRLEDECNGDYSNLYKSLVNILVHANNREASMIPSDEDLRTYLKDANAYTLKGMVKLFFERYENIDNNTPIIDFSALSIEHIMPQRHKETNLLSSTNGNEELYDDYKHRLGNLTLVSVKDNSGMGNKDFDSKMDFLSKSKHLRINSFLDNISKWDMSDIDSRTETLTNKMLDLFPYPKK